LGVYRHVVACVQVLEAIQRGIDKVNEKATSNAQRIQKWSILRRDFSTFGGELGQFICSWFSESLIAVALLHSARSSY